MLTVLFIGIIASIVGIFYISFEEDTEKYKEKFNILVLSGIVFLIFLNIFSGDYNANSRKKEEVSSSCSGHDFGR